jgi:hypothetical protein
MGFKRPLVQIQSLGPESDGKRAKSALSVTFILQKWWRILPNCLLLLQRLQQEKGPEA